MAMSSTQKREEAWIKKYGKTLGGTNAASDRLPPITQQQQLRPPNGLSNGGSGIPPLFQARGPIKSFPAAPTSTLGMGLNSKGGKQAPHLAYPSAPSDRSHNPSKMAGYQPRRPQCDDLFDVFSNIRDDESEHVKTMSACQSNTIAIDIAAAKK